MLCGIWMWFAYILAGLVMSLFIVTIPFGLASSGSASYSYFPLKSSEGEALRRSAFAAHVR